MKSLHCFLACALIHTSYLHADTKNQMPNEEKTNINLIEDPLAPIRNRSATSDQKNDVTWIGSIIGQSTEDITDKYGCPRDIDITKKTEVMYYNKLGIYDMRIYMCDGIAEAVLYVKKYGNIFSESELFKLLETNKRQSTKKWRKVKEEFNNIVFYLGEGSKLRGYLLESGTSLCIASQNVKNIHWRTCTKNKNPNIKTKKYVLRLGDSLKAIIERNGPPCVFNILGSESEMLVPFCGYEFGMWFDDYYSYRVRFINNRLESIDLEQNKPWSSNQIISTLEQFKINNENKWIAKNEEFIYKSYWLDDGCERRAYLKDDEFTLTICSSISKNILRSGITP